jgi:hypothetical protein
VQLRNVVSRTVPIRSLPLTCELRGSERERSDHFVVASRLHDFWGYHSVVLIASEGDERLVELIGYADLAALFCAATLLVAVVLVGAKVHSSWQLRIRMRLLLSLIYLIFLVATAGLYYTVYLKLDPFFVRLAISRRFAEAQIPQPRAEQLSDLATERTNEILSPPAEFVCVYPSWLVRFLPVGLIPAVLICRAIAVRRETAA